MVLVSQTGTAAETMAADAESITIMTAGIRMGDADAGMETAEDASVLRKMAADAEMISGRSRVLSKDLLCSTKILTVAATSRKITTVTERMCGKPHIFLYKGCLRNFWEPFASVRHLISKSRQS